MAIESDEEATSNVEATLLLPQCGDEAVRNLKALRQWLWNIPETEAISRVRPAPSLITRGEAELFGISSPRFAYRIYLGRNPEEGFVNARRLVRMREDLLKQLGAFDSWPHLDEVPDAWLKRHLDGQGDCIADSFLRLPAKRMSVLVSGKTAGEVYHVLEAQHLGRSYAEPKCPNATPFLQHTTLAGGMCAQAAIFMATALHHQPQLERQPNLYGIADITALMSGLSSGDCPPVTLGGLNPCEMTTFFEKFSARRPVDRLTAIHETELVTSANLKPPMLYQLATRQTPRLFQAYVASGVPIIVLVDLNSLLGLQIDEVNNEQCPISRVQDSVFAKNKLPNHFIKRFQSHLNQVVSEFGNKDILKSSDHCVVVVGCGNTPAHRNCFLINDPATVPFLEVTIDDLRLARRGSVNKTTGKWIRGNLEFIPILPPGVRCGLGHNSDTNFGLATCAVSLLTDPLAQIRFDPSAYLKEEGGDFRLIRTHVQKVADAGLEPLLQLVESLLDEQCAVELAKTIAKRRNLSAWCWAQFLPISTMNRTDLATLILWNAQLDGETLWTSKGKSVQSILGLDAERNWTELSESHRSLAVSVMTSYGDRKTFADKCDKLSSLFPESRPGKVPPRLGVEWYCFMEPEVKHAKSLVIQEEQAPSGSASHSAVEFLASLQDDQSKRIAIEISQSLKANSPHLQISALASFIPEISRNVHEQAAAVGRKAIRTLLKFASHLRELNHPVRVVELVAGSRFVGLLPGAGKNGRSAVSVLTSNQAQDNVIMNLKLVLLKSAPSGPCLALELEPGEYFTLNSLDALREMAEKLEKQDIGRVGFNLDIAHWRLAPISDHSTESRPIEPDDVRRCLPVMKRIVHGHISDHHPTAHFGDLPLIQELEASFRPWLDLLRDAQTINGPKGLAPSGFLSLELEAMRNRKVVSESLKVLSAWLT